MIRLVLLLGLTVLMTGCRTAGADVRQEFQIAYPDATPVQVLLNLSAGSLVLHADDAVDGLSGTIETNVSAWRATAETAADQTVRVVQGSSRTEVIPRAQNDWQIRMGTGSPLDLDVSTGAANSVLNLGGLGLETLQVNSVSGNVQLEFARPVVNSGDGRIDIRSTSGSLTLNHLLRSGARTLNTNSTSGRQTLSFDGGTLAGDMHVQSQATAGSVTLRIVEGLAVEIAFLTRSGVVLERAPVFEPMGNNTFRTAQFAEADGPRLFIEVQTVAGDLRIVSVPPA